MTFHWPIHRWSRFETAESWKSFVTPGTKSDTIHCVNLLCMVFTVHCHHCESWVLLSGGKCLSSMNVASVSESQRIQVQTAKLKTHCIAPQINLSYPLINIMFIIIYVHVFRCSSIKRECIETYLQLLFQHLCRLSVYDQLSATLTAPPTVAATLLKRGSITSEAMTCYDTSRLVRHGSLVGW